MHLGEAASVVLDRYGGTVMTAGATAEEGQVVAVISGRDRKVTDAVERLLRDFGLTPRLFDQALLLIPGGLPTTGEAVRKLFEGVQAAVVVFTPDDLAITHPDLADRRAGAADARYAGQPRQNVLIEAGMAIAALPKQAVLVRLGQVRRASDLDGVTVVDMASRVSVQRFARLLQQAGCTIAEDRIREASIPNISQLIAEVTAREAEPVYSDRGVSIFEAARITGLRDIEHRVPGGLHLPPSEFYARANVELAISAITASSTFEQFDDTVRRLLEDGKAVRVLILDPATEDMDRLSRRERRDLANNVRDVYRAIKRGRFSAFPNFEMRLAPFMYPFTGVMIDGNIGRRPSGDPEQLDDSATFRQDAEIRVQPGGYYTSQHRGPVLQFHITPDVGPFHHFATDLRRQWEQSSPMDFETFEDIVNV